MEKLQISYPIIVEGKYDKIKLDSLIDANIIKTDGFGLFNDKELQKLLISLSNKSPIIILTDSDGAGSLIRSKISSFIPKEKLIQLYIPKVEGKEKRKLKPSKEGTLGVEGTDKDILIKILEPFKNNGNFELKKEISKVLLYEMGLSGGTNSSILRNEFSKFLNLPDGLSAPAFLTAVNILYSEKEFETLFASFINKS